MLMVIVKIPSIHILQAIKKSMLLDKVRCCAIRYCCWLVCPHWLPIVPSPQTSLQMSIVLTNSHFAAHLSYI